MSLWGIVLAAGAGRRFGQPKWQVDLDGRTMAEYPIAICRTVCDSICLVLPAGATWTGTDVDLVIEGGDSHADSTRRAVTALPADADSVLIIGVSHPLVTSELAHAVVDALEDGVDAVAPLLPLADAVKTIDEAGLVRTPRVPPGLHTAQLPFAIRLEVLKMAIDSVDGFAEELEAVVAWGGTVVGIPGDARNIHIATRRDCEVAEEILRGERP